MTKYGISLPSLNTSLVDITEMITTAENAGLDSTWSYEFFRTPYAAMAAAAPQTRRVTLASGAAIALTRTPFTTANAIADIDELSCGRATLGLAAGSPDFLGIFHNTPLTKPISRMRDYLGALYASWDYLAHGKPGSYQGEFYSVNFPDPDAFPFDPRPLVRDKIPVYVAAMRPAMIRLAAEMTDGVLGAAMSIPYLKDVVLPNVAAGARRANRDPSTIDIASETIICVSKDRSEALHRARIQAGLYAAHPVCEPVVRAAGLEKEQAAVREALMTKGPSALQDVTDEKLIELLSVTGTPDECRRKLKDYEEVLPHIIFHTPYAPPLTAEESADSFRSILETFGN